jgi:transcriptional regulator with GAF, ATPase, and Fis domain
VSTLRENCQRRRLGWSYSLRVLQEQEFERLGSGRTHRIDIRVLAATHRDLNQLVESREFRSDLYYRLNVFPVLIPPLRERRDDIRQLVLHFVDVFSRRMGKRIELIPPSTMDAFSTYHWPGNVRELQNLVERAVIRADNGTLPNPISTSPPNPAPNDMPEAILTDRECRERERANLVRALERAGGRIYGEGGAAELLGINPTTLASRLRAFKIRSTKLRESQGDCIEG